MDHLPIFINIRQRPCLVIGGGDIALRKINLLIKAQAKVDCLSPLFREGITRQEFCLTLIKIGRWSI